MGEGGRRRGGLGEGRGCGRGGEGGPKRPPSKTNVRNDRSRKRTTLLGNERPKRPPSETNVRNDPRRKRTSETTPLENERPKRPPSETNVRNDRPRKRTSETTPLGNERPKRPPSETNVRNALENERPKRPPRKRTSETIAFVNEGRAWKRTSETTALGNVRNDRPRRWSPPNTNSQGRRSPAGEAGSLRRSGWVRLLCRKFNSRNRI